MKKFLAGILAALLTLPVAAAPVKKHPAYSDFYLLPRLEPFRAQISSSIILVGTTPVFGTCTNGFNLFNNNGVVGCQANGGGGGSGTVTSVGWTGGIVSVGTPTTTPAFTIAGTSGGIPYFSSASTWASSGLLAANALMIGGGAGTAPGTTTTGANVLTALGAAINATTGLPNVLGAITTGDCLIWGPGIQDSGVAGCAGGGGAVASVGNAAADTSLTIAGTGAGPWTGAVTAKVNLTNAQTWSNQTFVAPVLGAATGTSLALNGSSLATNGKFALNYSPGGNANNSGLSINNANPATVGVQQDSCLDLSGFGWKTTATAASQPVDWMICNTPTQSTTNPIAALTFYYQINGGTVTQAAAMTSGAAPSFQNGSASGYINPSGAFLTAGTGGGFQFTTNSVANSGSTADTFLTRHAAANVQLGNADAAAPIAQSFGVQSVVAGTSNTAGQNWTHIGSLSTGSGTSGDMIFQTGGTGAAATVQNTAVTALTIKGATQNAVFASAIIGGGSHPTLTTGSCSGSGAVGGEMAGTFVAATCTAGTYILSALPTAPNGYACDAQDQTTSTDTLKQTANTTSSVTFLATTVASDVVVFKCMGF